MPRAHTEYPNHSTLPRVPWVHHFSFTFWQVVYRIEDYNDSCTKDVKRRMKVRMYVKLADLCT